MYGMINLTVPVENLDVTITTPGGQEPIPIAMSPPRPDQEQEDPEAPHKTGPSAPSLPDTALMDQESTDDIPLYEMFSSGTDRDTSNSAHTSVSLSQDELDNVDEIIATPNPPPGEPDIAQASVSTWLAEHGQLYQTPTPTPEACSRPAG